MKKSLVFGLIAAGLFFTGCSQNLARFSVASTGNLPMQNVEKGDYVKGKVACGTCLDSRLATRKTA